MVKFAFYPWFEKLLNLYVYQTNSTYNFPRWRDWLKSTFNCKIEYYNLQNLVFENEEDVVTFKLMVS